jgi:hypothetical protein
MSSGARIGLSFAAVRRRPMIPICNLVLFIPLTYRLPFLTALYTGYETSLWRETVLALGRIGPAARPAIPLLEELTATTDPDQRDFGTTVNEAEIRQALKRIRGD